MTEPMSSCNPGQPLFDLGNIVATPGALAALEVSGDNYAQFLSRHVRGDWGIVCAQDAKSNDLALKEGSRIFSVYQTMKGTTLWLITEGDRSVTTLLLPEEY